MSTIDPRFGWHISPGVSRLHWGAWSPQRGRWVTLCGLPVMTATVDLDRPLCATCHRLSERLEERAPSQKGANS